MPYPNNNWNVVLKIKHKICYYCQWLKASNIWPFDGFSMWRLKNVSITICSTWYVHLVCPKKSWKAKSLPRTEVLPVAKSIAHMTPIWSMTIEECHYDSIFLLVYSLGVPIGWSWKVQQKVCHAPKCRQWLKASRTWLSPLPPLFKMVSAHWLQPRACCKCSHWQRESSGSNSNVISRTAGNS